MNTSPPRLPQHNDSRLLPKIIQLANTTATGEGTRRFRRGEYLSKIRFRGFPIRLATKVITDLLWHVTGSYTCVVISVEKSYFSEILAAMRLSGFCRTRHTATRGKKRSACPHEVHHRRPCVVVSQARSWSPWLVLGAILWARIAKS